MAEFYVFSAFGRRRRRAIAMPIVCGQCFKPQELDGLPAPIGIMENKMETTVILGSFKGYIGIMEKWNRLSTVSRRAQEPGCECEIGLS